MGHRWASSLAAQLLPHVTSRAHNSDSPAIQENTAYTCLSISSCKVLHTKIIITSEKNKPFFKVREQQGSHKVEGTDNQQDAVFSLDEKCYIKNTHTKSQSRRGYFNIPTNGFKCSQLGSHFRLKSVWALPTCRVSAGALNLVEWFLFIKNSNQLQTNPTTLITLHDMHITWTLYLADCDLFFCF